MDLKKYYKKISEIEQFASEHPEKYRRRLIALALFGIISLILLVVCSSILAVAIAFRGLIYPAILIGLMNLTIIKALFNKYKPEEGTIKLSKRQFPELYRRINEMSREINGPRVNLILVNMEINAAVNQSLFRSNYLLIGLPLALSLSYEQFQAVLAHELGHLSNGHSRTTNMICRTNQMWSNATSGGTIRAILLYPFTKFYVPLLERYSLALRKRHEIDADAVSVAYSGIKFAAQALAQLYAFGSLLEKKIRDEIVNKIEKIPEVPADFSICRLYEDTIRNQISNDEINTELEKNLRCGSMPDDSHPDLRTRFAHIGVSHDIILEKVVNNAAENLFSENFRMIVDKLDSLHRKEVKDGWHSMHFYYQDCRKRIQGLEKLKSEQKLSEENYFDIIDAIVCLENNTKAIALAEEAVNVYPNNVALRFRYKCLMLEEDDPRGEDILREPHIKNLEQIYIYRETIYNYLYRNGKIDELLDFINYVDKNEETALQKLEKAIDTSPDSNFLSHDQSNGSLEPLIQVISKDKCILDAWLVKIDTSRNVGQPVFLLVLNLKSSLRFLDAQYKYTDLFDAVDFPYVLRIQICFTSNKLVEKVSCIKNSHIWSKQANKSC